MTANPDDYATNGLVSDYVEKEFELDPNTIDTADSHMLDTWNLTFDLGSGSPALPSSTYFRYYYENSSYDFADACQQYSPQESCQLPSRAGTLISNLSATSATQTGDSTPWAASVRWTGTGTNSALSQLEGMISREGGQWLRATTGTYDGNRTITVWGKLSWGANPLSQSTRSDGLADGNQSDPLEQEVVQFNVSYWSEDLWSSNDEGAPYFMVSSGPNGTGTIFYQGYGPGETNSSGAQVWYIGTYLVSVPVTTSSQYVYCNLSLNDARSTGTFPELVNSSEIDLVGGGVHSLDRSNSNHNATVDGSYQVLRVAEAANTLLWAPANNTTLSNLPWGLKRYTGEPDFDLFVLNVSAAITVTGIEGAEGGYTYSVSLNASLNNLLVPRGAFLSSPLGQALINNTNESASRSGSGVTFHPKDWSSRTETSATNPVPSSSNNWNPNFIWIFSSASQSQNGSSSAGYGGLPLDPSAESGCESLQVQSVIWANVSASGYGNLTSARAEVKDLLVPRPPAVCGT